MTDDLFHIALRGRGIGAIAGLATVGVLLFTTDARGEPGATEKATAEALFQQGTELMGEKQYAAACEKFAGSQQLDPALGTMLRLADCNDRIGKSASAWAMFKEASSVAHTRNEPERWRVADERGAELEKRLSKLEIKLESKNVPQGFELKLNGVSIPRATWDAAIPVDPGKQKLEASAPGRVTWIGTVEVPDGPAQRSIEVPTSLAVKPASADPNGAALSAGAASSGRDSASSPGSTQRTIGYVTSALGIVGIGIGGFLGYRAYSLNHDSLDHCSANDANACTPEGKSLRDDAQNAAMGSTIALVAGGALTVGGLVLVLTAPKSDARHAGTDLKVSTGFVGRGPGVSLEGTW